MISKCKKAGFTLVELLIVIVIIAILAAVAIPNFTHSAEDAKASSMQANLSVLRTSLELYKLQHNGTYPGYPNGAGDPTATLYTDQMVMASQIDHDTAEVGTAGYPFGPYVRKQLPVNPVNNLNTIKVLVDTTAFPTTPDGTTGWIYKPLDGKIRPNCSGSAPSGTNWFDF